MVVFTDATNGNVIEAPIKDVTTAKTTVSARSGQTIVLGGMITKDTVAVDKRVPLLGSIPLVGWLFRHDLDRVARHELLIFLTPRIISCDGDSELVNQVETGKVQFPADDVRQMHGEIVPAAFEVPCPAANQDLPHGVETLTGAAGLPGGQPPIGPRGDFPQPGREPGWLYDEPPPASMPPLAHGSIGDRRGRDSRLPRWRPAIESATIPGCAYLASRQTSGTGNPRRLPPVAPSGTAP